MQEIIWETLEHEPRHNEPEWFWALGIIVVSASIASILLGNALFAVLLVIAGFTLGIYAKRGPTMIKVQINDAGIFINNKFHPYKNIDSFSIDRDMLLIEKHAFLHPLISIPIDHDPEEVANFLKNFLPQKDFKEPLAHRFMEHLGF